MSKSSGEFLTLQALVDRGYHPLAYRMLCLQAHYRSELEFTWEGLHAALVRLKRMVMGVEGLKLRHSGEGRNPDALDTGLRRGDDWGELRPAFDKLESGVADDLSTASALVALEDALTMKKVDVSKKLELLATMDSVLGLNLPRPHPRRPAHPAERRGHHRD